MKRCSLCKNLVHEDDLIGVDFGMPIKNICPTCVDEMYNAISCKIAKIKDYAKVMHTGKKGKK